MLKNLNRLVSNPMRHYNDEWINQWCEDNGWTDLHIERCNNFWAFPPGAVMPEPIPAKVLRAIKAERGLTCEERIWSITAVVATMLAAGVTYWLRCPIPMVAAFAFNAVTVAQLEVEDAY